MTALRPPIRIRNFASSDIDALMNLYRGTVRIVARRDYTQDQVDAWAPDIIDRDAWALRCARRHTFMAEIEDMVVGFTELEPDGHLDMLYVHAEYQGIGIASALLLQVESCARRLGLERLYTEASITALRFFERRGFRVIAPQTVYIRGQELVNYRMEQRI